MIIELHLLQSYPTSNLNRDDVGQPKSVTFGGVTRGRISSQCLKRSARTIFSRYGIEDSETGVRTKRLLLHTARILDGVEDGDKGPSEETRDIVREALARLGFSIVEKELTQYLFFLGREATTYLADYCRERWDDLAKAARKRRAAEEKAKKEKKQLKEEKVKPDRDAVEAARGILDAGRAVDIALFGRMIANNRDFNVDAAAQVAHAISTHPVAVEFDYFTAVDDFKLQAADEDAGADMIGVVDFNAACYYRYANVDIAQLAKNLTPTSGEADEDLLRRATQAWIKAFANANPSGKQNSMAAHTRPETLLVVVREHGSWNLANAFLKPVAGTDIMEKSTRRMLTHFSQLRGFYGDDELVSVAGASLSHELDGLRSDEVVMSLDGLTDRAVASVFG